MVRWLRQSLASRIVYLCYYLLYWGHISVGCATAGGNPLSPRSHHQGLLGPCFAIIPILRIGAKSMYLHFKLLQRIEFWVVSAVLSSEKYIVLKWHLILLSSAHIWRWRSCVSPCYSFARAHTILSTAKMPSGSCPTDKFQAPSTRVIGMQPSKTQNCTGVILPF